MKFTKSCLDLESEKILATYLSENWFSRIPPFDSEKWDALQTGVRFGKGATSSNNLGFPLKTDDRGIGHQHWIDGELGDFCATLSLKALLCLTFDLLVPIHW